MLGRKYFGYRFSIYLSKLWILKIAIKSLEKQCIQLADYIKIMKRIKNKFNEVSCTKDVEIKNKFKYVIEKKWQDFG